MRELLGLSEGTVNPTLEEFLDRVHPDDRNLVIQAHKEKFYELTFRIQHVDGRSHVLHGLSFKTGDANSTDACVVYDITEEKHFLGEIQWALDRYLGLVEDMPVLACRFLPDGTLIYVNTAYADAYGVPRDAMIGNNWIDFLGDEDRDFVKAKITNLSPEVPSGTYEHWIKTPTGTSRSLSWTYRGFFDEGGNLTEIQLIGLDLTEQREVERQVFHMSKLRSLGELAAATAHELFQPLSTILLIAENLTVAVARERNDELIIKKLRTIISQSERLKFIVEKMKSLARPVSDVERTFLVREKVRENVEFLDYIFELDGVSVSVGDNGSDVRIFGNPDLFDQILINLLMNAREAVVDAAGKRPDLVPAVRLEVETDEMNGWGVIRVSDNGGGVDEALLPKLFEP
ncbi:MAG: PAS domain-containing protein, partial [Rhodospirillales bacterium]|nr:PAS domain-containing protein [Rhodospirillales bacterium]